jgi:UDP-N-acetylmuramyl tripeptide synthase
VRRGAAIAAAKTAALISRRFRLGGGTALPGLVAERIDPTIVPALARGLGHGSVLVTGTNGKTTTARLFRNIVEAVGWRCVANHAGSNMMRGIAAALVESAGLDGRFGGASRCIGVFEIDEATLPAAVNALKPRAVLFTNLFRDQLDRYGEVEYVAGVWNRAVALFPEEVTVVLNADDPSLAALADVAKGRVVFYGMKDRSAAIDGLEHAADARWCTSCGGELSYAAVFYGHLGHWRCPKCGRAWPPPEAGCARLEAGKDYLGLSIGLPDGEASVHLPLVGLYNAYNALAAAALAFALGIGRGAIEEGLNRFTAAFGRQEKMKIGGRDVQVILAKNPAGLNQVLRAITADTAELSIVLFLNDNIADGRDVSWIWDVDFEVLAPKARSLTASGLRAWDMALRLKYAGLEKVTRVEPEPAAALREALKDVPAGQTLYVIPTYTAMLEVRDLLAGWAGRGSFWEEG